MKRFVAVVVSLLVIAFAVTCPASASDTKDKKTAIVLASFGTSYPDALQALVNIEKEIKKAYPGVPVKHAFTSNIIRKIWHERQNDKKFLAENKRISKDFLYVKTPLATIADLQDQGYDTIIVQSTHVFAGEEYVDLCSYINGLNSIKTLKKKFMPFSKLVVGRPALGKPGIEHDYHEDLEKAARALESDVKRAARKKAALVYMGHGNEYFSTGAYIEFQALLNKMYPKTPVLIGTVEGYPSLDDVVAACKHMEIKKIVLRPLMVVAGDHAQNDMAGDEEDSWKSTFENKGIKVIADVEGLGENDKWAGIYAEHIADVAKDNGIEM